MCTSLFCAQAAAAQASCPQLFHLGRLLLAQESDELLPCQRVGVPARLAWLLGQVQDWVARSQRVSSAYALHLSELLLARLLGRACCRYALHSATSLAEALGPQTLLPDPPAVLFSGWMPSAVPPLPHPSRRPGSQRQPALVVTHRLVVEQLARQMAGQLRRDQGVTRN